MIFAGRVREAIPPPLKEQTTFESPPAIQPPGSHGSAESVTVANIKVGLVFRGIRGRGELLEWLREEC